MNTKHMKPNDSVSFLEFLMKTNDSSVSILMKPAPPQPVHAQAARAPQAGWHRCVTRTCPDTTPQHPRALTCTAKGHCQPLQPPLPTQTCPWKHKAPQAVYPAQNNPDYSKFRSGFGADTCKQGMPRVPPTT